MRTHHLAAFLILVSVACDAGEAGPRGPEGPAGPAGPDDRIAIHLPGPSFFPEGIAAASDGTLYVGSLGTGQIVRVPRGALGAEPLVAGRAAFGIYGVAVDEARDTLWACTYDDLLLPEQAAYLTSYALDTGAKKAAYPLPADGIVCNDLDVDAAGNVYLTDSMTARILRLPVGGAALELWAAHELFVAPEWQWGLNGVVLDGAGNLYVVKTVTGELLRVPVLADGTAGEPVAIAVEPPLETPDGIELIDPETLLVVEHVPGQVSVVRLADGAGTKEVVANGFLEATTAALVDDGSAWIVEGQLRYFGAEELPNLPFRVHRVALP